MCTKNIYKQFLSLYRVLLSPEPQESAHENLVTALRVIILVYYRKARLKLTTNVKAA